MLACEAEWWLRPGAKAQGVRDVFGWTESRYYQLLSALLDRPEALEHAPVVVGRLRELRHRRASIRSARRAG